MNHRKCAAALREQSDGCTVENFPAPAVHTEQQNRVTVAQAIELALRYKKASFAHRYAQESCGRILTGFFREQFQVNHFGDLRPFMVQELFNSLSEKYQPNYVRKFGTLLCTVSDFLSDNYPEEFRAIPIHKYLPAQNHPPKKFLTFQQWLQCLQIARGISRPASFGFMVTSMTGMRMLELCRLTPRDFLRDGCIHIHHSKNDGSERIIPVPSQVRIRLMQVLIKRRADQPIYSNYSAITNKMRNVLKIAAEQTGDETFSMIAPHEAGRKTFDNLCVSLGIPFELKEGYQGRALPNASSEYSAVRCTPDDMPTVREHVIKQLNDKLVIPIEKHLEAHGL